MAWYVLDLKYFTCYSKLTYSNIKTWVGSISILCCIINCSSWIHPFNLLFNFLICSAICTMKRCLMTCCHAYWIWLVHYSWLFSDCCAKLMYVILNCTIELLCKNYCTVLKSVAQISFCFPFFFLLLRLFQWLKVF